MCEKIKKPLLRSSKIYNTVVGLLEAGEENGGADGFLTKDEAEEVRKITRVLNANKTI